MNRLTDTALDADVCFDRLHRAGWNLGEWTSGDVWTVTGWRLHGEWVIHATGATQGEAWRGALRQAELVGMAGDA